MRSLASGKGNAQPRLNRRPVPLACGWLPGGLLEPGALQPGLRPGSAQGVPGKDPARVRMQTLRTTQNERPGGREIARTSVELRCSAVGLTIMALPSSGTGGATCIHISRCQSSRNTADRRSNPTNLMLRNVLPIGCRQDLLVLHTGTLSLCTPAML